VIAVDTNIFVYAETPDDSCGRHAIAARLLTRLGLSEAVIPAQVLAEFLNVCRRKKLVPLGLAAQKVRAYSQVFVVPPTTAVDTAAAAQLSAKFDLQFFDALIIAVARRAGATILLSEDMADGLVVDGLSVVNPFVSANDALLEPWLA
jgi:predicted nucleic acid-binding protein